MGRRALRKIDTNLDLSRHLHELEENPPCFDADRWFGRKAPLEVEVGSGKGLFLATAASRTPEHDFVGLEIARRYAQFAAARLARAALPNALLIRGDAQTFLRDGLGGETVAAVHVYFPDPWWKKRHHKRRVMNESFLLEIARVLHPDGRLHFWTDVAEYFAESLELIARRIPLAGPQPVAESPALNDLDFRTHFERRTRLRGEAVYRAEFVKPRGIGQDRTASLSS